MACAAVLFPKATRGQLRWSSLVPCAACFYFHVIVMVCPVNVFVIHAVLILRQTVMPLSFILVILHVLQSASRRVPKLKGKFMSFESFLPWPSWTVGLIWKHWEFQLEQDLYARLAPPLLALAWCRTNVSGLKNPRQISFWSPHWMCACKFEHNPLQCCLRAVWTLPFTQVPFACVARARRL